MENFFNGNMKIVYADESKFSDVNKLIKKSYPEIYKSMKKNRYKCEYPSFEIFHEIQCDGKVVGFFTLDKFALNTIKHTINEVYIMPEYRGKHLFFECLLQLFLTANMEIYARKPNLEFIKFLLGNGLAIQLTDNIVVSYIKFVVKAGDSIITKKTNSIYQKIDNEYSDVIYYSNNFNTDICSVFHSDKFVLVAKDDNTIVFSKPTHEDFKKYNLKKKYKKMTPKYVYEVQYNRAIRNDEIDKFIQDLDKQIQDFADIDNMVGTESQLNDNVVEFLKDCGLSMDDAFEIRKHLVRELKNKNITYKSKIIRFLYLADNFEDVDKNVKLEKTTESTMDCPFCGEECYDFLETCPLCGQYIRGLFLNYDEDMLMTKEILNDPEFINFLNDEYGD